MLQCDRLDKIVIPFVRQLLSEQKCCSVDCTSVLVKPSICCYVKGGPAILSYIFGQWDDIETKHIQKGAHTQAGMASEGILTASDWVQWGFCTVLWHIHFQTAL